MAAVSGFAEPVGALLAWRFLAGRLGESGLALIYCGVGGLMTALSFGELLPAAWRTGGAARPSAACCWERPS